MHRASSMLLGGRGAYFGDYMQMGLCLGPEVPNWALIRSRDENKTKATDLELKDSLSILMLYRNN